MSPADGPAPVPHDPTVTQASPQEVRASVDKLLARPAEEPEAEAETLEAAHAVLQAALKDQPLPSLGGAATAEAGGGTDAAAGTDTPSTGEER